MLRKSLILISMLVLSKISFAESNQTSLPLQFDFGNPAPYGGPSTFVTIQGMKIPVLLDTGAKKSELSLSRHALKKINVRFLGKDEYFYALDGKYCEKVFIIPEIKIGSFAVKNVKGITMSKLWGGNDEGLD